MKDIITDTSMTETRKIAVDKWHEYAQAARKTNDPVYKDLQKIYNQVKNGRKVIDIGKVIAKGGVHPNQHPKLAIAQVTSKKVSCKYSQNGDVKFLNSTWESKADVILPVCLPVYTFQDNDRWRRLELEAPVPIIPPKIRPSVVSDDYYILWEVDVWKMVPPTDPYLLRRITKNMFVVLAGWDLTEIEKSAMAGRMV